MRLALVLFLACTPVVPGGGTIPPEDSPDRFAMSTSVDAWRQAGFPYSSSCQSEFSRIHVSSPQDSAQWGCAPQHGGCYRAAWSGNWLNAPRRAALFVRHEYDPYRRARVLSHETIHWLAHCSVGSSDAQHQNLEWWGNYNGSVEAAARAVLHEHYEGAVAAFQRAVQF